MSAAEPARRTQDSRRGTGRGSSLHSKVMPGVIVGGQMTMGLGALAAWRNATPARRVVKTALLVGVVAGAVMWITGLTAGSGFLV